MLDPILECSLTSDAVKLDCNMKYAFSDLYIPSQVLKNFLDTAEAEVKSLTTLYIEVVSLLAFVISYFKCSWKCNSCQVC